MRKGNRMGPNITSFRVLSMVSCWMEELFSFLLTQDYLS
jgi:hypothetical protein